MRSKSMRDKERKRAFRIKKTNQWELEAGCEEGPRVWESPSRPPGPPHPPPGHLPPPPLDPRPGWERALVLGTRPPVFIPSLPWPRTLQAKHRHCVGTLLPRVSRSHPLYYTGGSFPSLPVPLTEGGRQGGREGISHRPADKHNAWWCIHTAQRPHLSSHHTYRHITVQYSKQWVKMHKTVTILHAIYNK